MKGSSLHLHDYCDAISYILQIKNDVFLLNTALQIAETHTGYLHGKANTESHQGGSDKSRGDANWCVDNTASAKFFDDIMTVLAAIQVGLYTTLYTILH